MADKKTLILLAPSAAITSDGDSLGKLVKKGAFFTDFAAGDVIGNAVESSLVTKAQPADVAELIEKGEALIFVDLGNADTAALNSALETIFEATDRKTVLAVVGSNGLVLYGNSIDSKVGTVARKACAADIIPTLAYIADFAVTKECAGAILYQALKSPNLKMDEVAKLKEALVRMESVIARDNREPWDKHDCA